MNIRHDPDSERNKRMTRDAEREVFALQQQHKREHEQRFESWIRSRPGNVRRAPRKEQLRQWQHAIL